jgi:hypothetical protein
MRNQAELKLSGASNPAIMAEMYDVMTEFFEHSNCWIEALKIDGVAYGREYSLIPTEGQIIRLIGVVQNSLFSTNAAYEAVEDANPPTSQDIGNWTPVAALMPQPSGGDDPNYTVFIRFPQNVPVAMRAYVAKNVTQPQDKNLLPAAPDWLIQRWHNVILDGILGKMMTTPSMTYTDSAQGTYHLKRFQDGIARARVAALKANTFGAQSWNFPANWNTRSQRGYLNVSVGNDQRFG